MNSSGHRANILRASFAHIGVGHGFRQQTTFGNYWSQSFGGGSALVSQCGAAGPIVAQLGCQDDQLASLARSCRAQLACHAKHAKKPTHPKAAAKRARCLAKGAAKFSRRWEQALDAGAAALVMCTVSDSSAAAEASLAAELDALVASVVAGQDPGSREDGKLRARLLQEAGRLCDAVMPADASAEEIAAARTRFDERAAKAEARAAQRGVSYDGAGIAGVGDAAEAVANGWLDATTPQ
jgi:hypothetical protein